MAQISLKVLTDIGASKEQLEALKKSVKSIAKTLSSVRVNKDLTAQINALTKHYEAVANAAQKVAKVNYENEIREKKLALATAKLNTELQREINLRNQDSRAAERDADRKAKADEKAAQAKEKATQREAKSNQALEDKVVSLRKSYANLLNTIQATEKNYKKGTFSSISNEAKKYLTELQNLDPASKDFSERVTELDKNLKRLGAEFSETKTQSKNFHGSLKDIITGFVKFQLAATLVMKPLQMLREAYDDLNETLVKTEKHLVSLRRVAGDEANADAIYKHAQKYGQSFENVSDVVERFAKAGYDWARSLNAAESALVAMNVAELDSEQATEGLIAIMKQFKLDISELPEIVGILNKTADDYAVDTEELLIALQKTGSVAKNAGLDLKETAGLITALSEGTAASGQNIGNALRSLFVFTSDDKALDTFAGLSSNMQKVVEDFRAGKTSILEVWRGLGSEMGSRQDFKEVFGGVDLSADMEAELTQIQDQLAEIYGTAGNYRQNYFIALLDNIETATKATENMTDVLDYSNKENNLAMETYEKKVVSLQEKWHAIANDEQGFLQFKKDMVDVASGALNILESLGGIKGALETVIAVALPFMARWAATFAVDAFNAARIGVVSLFNAIKTGAISANAALGAIGIALGIIVTAYNAMKASQEAAFEKSYSTITEATAKQSQYADSIANTKKELDDYIQKIQDLREVMESSAATESTKQNAQNQLLTIQNELIESNKSYADSLDLINGKLEDQIGLISDIQYEKLRQSVIDYYNENVDAYLNAEKVLREGKYDQYFGEEMGDGSVEMANWLLEHGYSLDYIKGNNYSFLKGNFSVSAKELQGKNIDQIYWELKRMRDVALKEGASEYVQAQIQAEIKYLEEKYGEALNLHYGSKNPKNFIESLNSLEVKNIATGNTTLDEFKKHVNDFFGITDGEDDPSSTINKTAQTLSELNETVLSSIVEKLEKARDATKDAYEYEEKKKAVLEAEKALLDAQNNRTVRVWNAEAGRWEWKSNEKDVQDARERLEEARLAVEEAAYDNIIDELNSGNATNTSILKIVSTWAAAYGSGDFSGIEKAILGIIEAETGIKVMDPNHSYRPTIDPKPNDQITPTYDSGGVLQGMGGIKATSRDEIVLGPDLTSKILSPVSNERFNAFTKDLGLLFGASKTYTNNGTNVVQNSSTSSDSHDSHYTVNGVPIAPDVARSYSLAEIFSVMNLIPN